MLTSRPPQGASAKDNARGVGAPTEGSHRSLRDAARFGAELSSNPDVPVRRDGVLVRPLADDGELEQIVSLLDAEEARTGLGLIDEAERHRLGELARGSRERGSRWRSLLAWAEGRVVGYAGLVLEQDATATGDVAVLGREANADQAVLRALLAASSDAVGSEGEGPRRLQVWTRQAGREQADAAAAEGFEVHRRLGVLGRALDAEQSVPPQAGADIRAYRPGEDDEAVVAVLAAAYGGTDDGGWDLATFRERTRLPWFRADDLLVADVGPGSTTPRVAGLHWLKRRSEVQGEVYNLAVHPAAQGRRLGPALLHAGLARLRDTGCREVLLWVDLANHRAVELYTSQGFETRSEDLALVRDCGRAHAST
jgi:mycothiol synthase